MMGESGLYMSTGSSLDFVDWDEEDPFAGLPNSWEKQGLEESGYDGQDFDLLPGDLTGATLGNMLESPFSMDVSSTTTKGFNNAPPPPPSVQVNSVADLTIPDDDMYESAPPSKLKTISSSGASVTSTASSTNSKRSRKAGKASDGNHANETSSERKERMAAACRKFRAKRKEEMASLREKNKHLEQERDAYLQRIAELQVEATTLRDHGIVDIKAENELLRAEIRKHKRFISSLVNAVNNTPMVTDEEKLRLLQDGIASALGQVLGLAYTSAGDPSWKIAPSEIFEGQIMHVKYQYLPLDAGKKDLKRINLRMDLPGRPEGREHLKKKLWESWENEEMVRTVFKTHFPELFEKSDFAFSEIFPELPAKSSSLDWTKHNIKVFHYVEMLKTAKETTSSDMILGMSMKESNIFQAAFPAGLQGADGRTLHENMDEGPIPASIMVATSSSALQRQAEYYKPVAEGVNRVTSPMLEGYVLHENKDGTTHVTFVGSYPLDSGLFGFGSGDGAIISEDGCFTEFARQLFHAMLTFIEM